MDQSSKYLTVGKQNANGSWYGWGMRLYQHSLLLGEFTDGDIRNGNAFYKRGDTYTGGFLAGRREGAGEYSYPSGDIYIGHFKNDEKHGPGIYRWFTGEQFNGKFKAGLMHGEGSMIFPDGFSFKDEWRLDYPQNTDKTASTHPKVRSFIEGKICTAKATLPYCQWLWKCVECKARFCEVCLTSCHHGEDHQLTIAWNSSKWCCGCEDCKSHQPVTKKQKIS